jgi:hypothetical protein
MLTTLLLLALGTTPLPATLGDYVLNVPIRIENMRNATSATLNCDILHIGTSATDRVSLGTPGSGRVTVPLVDGAFSGTVTATVVVSAANAIRSTPTTWSCILVFLWRNPDGSIFNESLSSSDERVTLYTRLTGQAIAESTLEVSGPLP